MAKLNTQDASFLMLESPDSPMHIGFMLTFVGTVILVAIGRIFQLWRVLPERTVLVYTFFGKVVGQVDLQIAGLMSTEVGS